MFSLLDLCEQFDISNLRKLCANFLAENFGEMLKGDTYLKLDPDTLAEMLNSDEIVVDSEEQVFRAVIRYGDKKYEQTKDKKKRDEIFEK